MQIFVKSQTNKTFALDVERSDNVKAVKLKVSKRDGIPPQYQNLVYAGKQLSEELTLKDYGVSKDSTLYTRPSNSHVPEECMEAIRFIDHIRSNSVF